MEAKPKKKLESKPRKCRTEKAYFWVTLLLRRLKPKGLIKKNKKLQNISPLKKYAISIHYELR